MESSPSTADGTASVASLNSDSENRKVAKNTKLKKGEQFSRNEKMAINFNMVSSSSNKLVTSGSACGAAAASAAAVDVHQGNNNCVVGSGSSTSGDSDSTGSGDAWWIENCITRLYRRKTKGLTSSQIGILLIFPFVEFFAATVISIQGPFYPQVAREKGATPSEYGIVFGSFELTVFICAPIFGAKMGFLKPHRLFNYGIFTTSTCCVIFGFLHHFSGRHTFILSSVLVRVIEAIGDAGFVTASFSIIAAEFPDSVATTFALMETFYGLGMIAGPTVGGALYQIGGFTLPFVVMGFLLFCSAIGTYFFVTREFERKDLSDKIVSSSSFGMFRMFKIPVIALTAFSTFAGATGIGFLSNNLERHLEQFGVNEFEVGSIFMLNGGVYALSAPIWGKLCERSSQPKMFSLIGSVLIIIGFALIGPIPFIESWEPSVLVICGGLIILGLGLGATLVSAFLLFLQDAIAHGHPEDVNTHGLVSGLWTSMTALGFFVGPTIGGFLDDYVGFRWGTLFIFGEQFILVGLLTCYFCYNYNHRKSPTDSTESQPIDENHEKDDLNDIVITYAVKMDTPNALKQGKNHEDSRKTEDGSETKQQHPQQQMQVQTGDEQVPVPTEANGISRNRKIGMDNPNFLPD